MISKMKPVEEGGSRIAIVFNGSPLFTGAAGSGESEIRRWIIENDLLEAVIALPDQLFYNTDISTYFWIVTNRKSAVRRGKVQLVDGRDHFTKMRKSLGEKRKEISPDQIDELTRYYADFRESEKVKIFPNEAFGYLRVTVERPFRVKWCVTETALTSLEESKSWKAWAKAGNPLTAADIYGPAGKNNRQWGVAHNSAESLHSALSEDNGDGVPSDVIKALVSAAQVPDAEGVLLTDKEGNPLPDTDLRDSENVPFPAISVRWEPDSADRLKTKEFRTASNDYLIAEVHPYVPDAWVNHDKTKIGYEIPLTRYFHKYVPPRPIAAIDADIKQIESEIAELLRGLTK
jgi:type I restriction enzyme M protein